MAQLISKVRTNLGGEKRGVALFPGRTAVVDDADVDRLLDHGGHERGGKKFLGLGRRLVADKLLVVKMDGSSDIARELRAKSFTDAVVALAEAQRAMPRDELRDVEPRVREALFERFGTDDVSTLFMPMADAGESPEPSDAEATRAETKADPKRAGELLPLTPETLAALSVAKAKPLIAQVAELATIERLVDAERAGENRKGMLDALEDRQLELLDAVGEGGPKDGG